MYPCYFYYAYSFDSPSNHWYIPIKMGYIPANAENIPPKIWYILANFWYILANVCYILTIFCYFLTILWYILTSCSDDECSSPVSCALYPAVQGPRTRAQPDWLPVWGQQVWQEICEGKWGDDLLLAYNTSSSSYMLQLIHQPQQVLQSGPHHGLQDILQQGVHGVLLW